MGRRKAGGYIFEWYSGDHEPFHVHIYSGREFVGRYDVLHQRPMGEWKMTGRIRKALKQNGFFVEVEHGIAGKKN